MRVGLALPHYDFSYPDRDQADAGATVDWARRAEELGFDSVWVSDHFFLDLSRYGAPAGRRGSLEPMTMLAGIAAATKRVRLGTLVLCEAFRAPAQLAREAATLDLLSGGRLDLGLGAGWLAEEYAAGGFEFDDAPGRMSRLEESVRITGALLAGQTLDFAGEHYRVTRSQVVPGPSQKPRPPIWVGSKGGPRSLRLVAEHADGWNTVWRWSPDAYAERARMLDAACDKAKRDPATVKRSVGLYTFVGDDLDAILERAARRLPRAAIDAATATSLRDDALAGSAEQCAERVRAFARLGVSEIIVAPAPLPFAVPDAGQVERIARDLIPLVRDA